MLSAAFTLATFASSPITGTKWEMQWWQIPFRFSLPPSTSKLTLSFSMIWSVAKTAIWFSWWWSCSAAWMPRLLLTTSIIVNIFCSVVIASLFNKLFSFVMSSAVMLCSANLIIGAGISMCTSSFVLMAVSVLSMLAKAAGKPGAVWIKLMKLTASCFLSMEPCSSFLLLLTKSISAWLSSSDNNAPMCVIAAIVTFSYVACCSWGMPAWVSRGNNNLNVAVVIPFVSLVMASLKPWFRRAIAITFIIKSWYFFLNKLSSASSVCA